jgi:hypothetical protein
VLAGNEVREIRGRAKKLITEELHLGISRSRTKLRSDSYKGLPCAFGIEPTTGIIQRQKFLT